MRVIATAGHVDHGKSTLVRALTGINPDRLREEQRREMTIDLGFAWMNLPDGEPVGVIDVPGHIDFIDNMLAGVGGIDMALLVIAADEGPMPQTHEHLAILELLRVERAVVALTKRDLVDDDWLALISTDIRTLLSGTRIAAAPIVPVSARSRAVNGLDALLAEVTRVLRDAPARRDLGAPRLPVDRVFTLPGFGTIVTGTLLDGALALGDAVEVLTPRGAVHETHVRGLQTHKHKLERALPGSRVAINLSGLTVEQAERGSVVARPGTLTPSTLVDVLIEMLAEVPARHAAQPLTLKHNSAVKLFHGAAHSLAKVWLLDAEALAPGAQGWAQLQLDTPMALSSGDRFILRLPSPSLTIGGGTIIDPHPTRRYRRRSGRADEAVLTRLDALSRGTPEERLASALGALRFAGRDAAQSAAQLDDASFAGAAAALCARGLAEEAGGVLALTPAWRAAVDSARALLADFHARQPLAEGMPRESLRSQLGLSARVFDALLLSEPACAALAGAGSVVWLLSHSVVFDPAQQRAVDALLRQCQAAPWGTPLVKDAKLALGDRVFDVLARRRVLVVLNADVFLLAETYDDAIARVRAAIARDGAINAAQARDLFSTTRKYALALLEQLDTAGITQRVGDTRVLRT